MSKRKINIDDVGLDKRYYPVFDSHNLYSEGFGRKIHIIDDETGKCLCGYEPCCTSAVDYITHWGGIVNYLSQADPDKNFCQRCKHIMINALEIKEDSV